MSKYDISFDYDNKKWDDDVGASLVGKVERTVGVLNDAAQRWENRENEAENLINSRVVYYSRRGEIDSLRA